MFVAIKDDASKKCPHDCEPKHRRQSESSGDAGRDQRRRDQSDVRLQEGEEQDADDGGDDQPGAEPAAAELSASLGELTPQPAAQLLEKTAQRSEQVGGDITGSRNTRAHLLPKMCEK